ncbi:TonB-dependent receptor [Rhizomicrobium palustre]|nr:TonB-dependent receptor [Rhizomicrobium palustre]
MATVPAVAQDSMETVIVTGIRGSLQKSLDVKRESAGLVDAISAEDIGKFPDVNLAESMMRIPGITVTRGRGTASGGTGGTSSNGEASEITVRGFGPTFNETLFDGRKVATGTGNRAFDFSSVSSDFVSQIAILKTPDASLNAGAIGATINIKFPKPFDKPGLVVAASASGMVSPERGDMAPNGSFLISDTFAGDKFGILVAGSYSDVRTRQNHINNQGWEGKTVGANTDANAAFKQNQFAGTPPTIGTPVWFTQDYGIYHEIENVERIQGRVALQWRPTDTIEITLNDNYSRDNDHQAQYGYSVWFNSGSMSNIQIDKNGTIVNFQQTTPTDFQGQWNPQLLQYNDVGANIKWNLSDNFLLTLDVDHADGWSNPAGQVGIDVDVGYGNGGPQYNTVMGIVIPEGHGLPYPTFYGPGNDKSKFINNGIIGSHVIPMTMGKTLDTVNQVKLEGDWTESDAVSLKVGFQYVAEHKNQDSWDSFQNNNWQAYGGYGPASGNAPGNGVALPQDFFKNSFSTSDFISGWSGSGNLPPAILQYDPWDTLNYLNGLKGVGASNCCALTPGADPNDPSNVGRPFSGTYQVAYNPGSHQVLQEKTYSGFVQGTVKSSLAKMPLRVNFGVRYDITEENVSGLGRTVSAFNQIPSDLTAWDTVYVADANGKQTLPVNATHSYQYLLPNLDLTLSVTDTLDLRLNVSRTLTRPPIGSLNPVTNISTARLGSVTASGGNPDLLPFLSDNIDFGAQWYYAQNSYISVNSFLKGVDNFIITSSRSATYGNIGHCVAPGKAPCTAAGQIVEVPYTVSGPVNGPAANVYGLEVAWQHVFGETGFGFNLNGTIVGTNKPYNPLDRNISGFAVTGLADSANLMVFYDKDGFQARLAANWQDSYLDHFGHTQAGSDFGAEPVFVNTSWNLDFSTSYDITEQLTGYVSVQNLTGSTYSTHGRYSNQLLDAVDYGRKIIFGAHFKL